MCSPIITRFNKWQTVTWQTLTNSWSLKPRSYSDDFQFVSPSSGQRQSAVVTGQKRVNDRGEGGVLDGVWVFFSCINKCWRGTPVVYGASCVHISKQTNNRWTNEVLMWFGVLLLIKAMPQAWCLCKRHRTKCKRCGLYRRLKVTQDGEWEHKATCCQHLFRIHNISLKIVFIFIYMIRSSNVNWIQCISYCAGAAVRVCASPFESYFHIRCSLFITVET